MAKNVMIIAGEASGDKHAAMLLRALRKKAGDIRFWGIGGDEMASLGVELLYHLRQMAFLGLSEVVRHLPFILKVIRNLKKEMLRRKPDAIILVDYPGFNLRMAKIANNLGIPVIYYICPQLWAWGESRVEKIRRFVDLPLVIFEFERDFYAKHGIEAHFVGHPIVDEVEINLLGEEFRRLNGLTDDKPIIGMLPGSRKNEVRSLLPVLKEAIEKFPNAENYHWLISRADALQEQETELFSNLPDMFKLAQGGSHHLMKYSRVVISASGTATLETAFLGTPLIVLYKVAPLTYYIGKRLVKIEHISLANIVSGETVVPELIQNDATAEKLNQYLLKYLEDKSFYAATRKKLERIPALLGGRGAAEKAATTVLNFLETR